MKKLLITLLISLTLLCSYGCSTITKIEDAQRGIAGPVYVVDDNIVLVETQFIEKAKVLEAQYYVSKDEAEKANIREQIVFSSMNIIDLYYRKFYTSQYLRGAGMNTFTEITAGSLAGAGALFTNGTSRILSGISAMVIASNSSISKNYLAEKGIDVILDRMEANRIEAKAVIISNMKQSTSIYPLGQALLDVQDYAMAGTLPQAIFSLKRDTSSAVTNAIDSKINAESLKIQK